MGLSKRGADNGSGVVRMDEKTGRTIQEAEAKRLERGYEHHCSHCGLAFNGKAYQENDGSASDPQCYWLHHPDQAEGVVARAEQAERLLADEVRSHKQTIGERDEARAALREIEAHPVCYCTVARKCASHVARAALGEEKR